MPKVYPAFFREYELHNQGISLVAGIDEVGRGCWAGPVVAAAVLVSPEMQQALPLVTDSKQLTVLQRRALAKQIHKLALGIAVGESSAQEIDRYGIVRATRMAMLRAYWSLPSKPEVTLIDGRPIARIPFLSYFYINGDQRSYAIAAASVIAKVYRDQVMATTYQSQFPQYGFSRHKGYGTKLHQAALRAHGITSIHRRSFAPVTAFV